jgi:hypothetical protein
MSKNNKTNKNKQNRRVKINEEALFEAEKNGDITRSSGLKRLIVHDQTRHRTFTDAGRMPRARNSKGEKMEFECFVKRRSTAGPIEATLMLRSVINILDRETVIKILTESPEFIVNPEMTLSVARQLMIDGLITRRMVDEILDEKHPAWSQLDWKVDTELHADYISAFKADPDNKGKTTEDAEQAFKNLPTGLYRKEGVVKVSVRTDKGKRDFTIEIACEKVTLDNGRYFVALAKNCSPFRTAWLRLHGWKNKPRQIEGRPQNHRELPTTTPAFVKAEKDQLRLGEAILSQNPEANSLIDLLKDGGTITF